MNKTKHGLRNLFLRGSGFGRGLTWLSWDRTVHHIRERNVFYLSFIGWSSLGEANAHNSKMGAAGQAAGYYERAMVDSGSGYFYFVLQGMALH